MKVANMAVFKQYVISGVQTCPKCKVEFYLSDVPKMDEAVDGGFQFDCPICGCPLALYVELYRRSAPSNSRLEPSSDGRDGK